jgi:hypothetical protein
MKNGRFLAKLYLYFIIKTLFFYFKKNISMPSQIQTYFVVMSDIFEKIIFDGFAIQAQYCPQNNIIHATFDGVISDYECDKVFEAMLKVSEQTNACKWSFDLSNMHIHPRDLEDILTYWFPRMHAQSQGKGLYTIVLPNDTENRKHFVNTFEKGLCRKGCAYYFEDAKDAYHWLAGQCEHQGNAPIIDTEVKRNTIFCK